MCNFTGRLTYNYFGMIIFELHYIFKVSFVCRLLIDPNVVKLMVLSGYHLTIDEVEQCNRRIPTFSRSFRRLAFSGIDTSTNGLQMMAWLKERSHNPASLSDICRFSIRQSLNKGSGDTSILSNIRKLILPTCLKEYIALDEFSHLG